MEVISNVNAQRSAVRSIAWLGRLRWPLVREVKIEQNEFFEGSFPAFENRKVWIERESFCLMEVTTAPCSDPQSGSVRYADTRFSHQASPHLSPWDAQRTGA